MQFLTNDFIPGISDPIEFKIRQERRWMAGMAIGNKRIPSLYRTVWLYSAFDGGPIKDILLDEILAAVAELEATMTINARRPFAPSPKTLDIQWRWIRAVARVMSLEPDMLVILANTASRK